MGLNMAYEKEKEIRLAGLLTKTPFKKSEVKNKRGNLYGVWSDTHTKKCSPSGGVGRTGLSQDKPVFKEKLGHAPGG